MKNSRLIKLLGVLCVLILIAALSACTANPDSSNGDKNATGIPYQTYPIATETPVITDAPLVVTPTPGPGTQNFNTNGSTNGAATATPTIGVVTQIPTVTPTVSPTPSLYVNGSSGDGVKTIQQLLKTLGYYTGEVDGSFGDATEAAVKTFQSQNGLTADGKVGASTLDKLNSSSAVDAASVVYKLGSSGDMVKTIQQRLKTLRYYYGSVDGDFGEATKTAVIAFQKMNGLSADGIVGSSTLAKLNSSSAATAKPTSSPTPKATATPSFSDNTYLSLGASGTKVTQLQTRLISLGYLLGEASGSYCKQTEQGVIAFQKRNTSYYDGVAGPLTLEALYSSSAKSTSTAQGIIGITLASGDEGAAVRLLQTQLRALGYYDSSVDGSFGSSTKAAVVAFQAANNLSQDGKAGPGTLNVMFGGDALSSNETGSGTGTYVYVTAAPNGAYVTLEEGLRGTLVEKLQQALKDLGYYTGSVDGFFGSSTTDAVLAFQKARGLSRDGKAGYVTQQLLYGKTATPRATATPNATATPTAITYVKVTPNPDGDYVTLVEGMYGDLVKDLQKALKDKGYYSGAVDGYFGTATTDAVLDFQADKGLSQDGKAGPSTQSYLYEGDYPDES